MLLSVMQSGISREFLEFLANRKNWRKLRNCRFDLCVMVLSTTADCMLFRHNLKYYCDIK